VRFWHILPSADALGRERPQNKDRGEAMITLHRLWKDEEGQDLVEYALLVVLIALGAIAAMKGLSSAISDAFSNATKNLTAAS
jgi:pilus assembly protein Flp/PilA